MFFRAAHDLKNTNRNTGLFVACFSSIGYKARPLGRRPLVIPYFKLNESFKEL